MPKRNKNNICCPEYGLTVVNSSNAKDIPFTLSGSNNRIMANMNMYLPAKDYWKSRALPEYKYLIDQIYDEKYIHLTDLYLLFNSMGFQHIYIYDPTCRDCEIDDIRAQQYRNQELSEPIIQQPDNTIVTNRNQNTNINNYNYMDDCINGVCNYFKKTKINGGKNKTNKKGNKSNKKKSNNKKGNKSNKNNKKSKK